MVINKDKKQTVCKEMGHLNYTTAWSEVMKSNESLTESNQLQTKVWIEFFSSYVLVFLFTLYT